MFFRMVTPEMDEHLAVVSLVLQTWHLNLEHLIGRKQTAVFVTVAHPFIPSNPDISASLNKDQSMQIFAYYTIY